MHLETIVRRLDPRKIPQLIFLSGLIIGAAFFCFYYYHGLTTAHYDAKAHLLVARRIVDSLEPGYAQMGAQWLPLIHLLYLPFIIFDFQYVSGFIPSLISIFSFALSGVLVYRISFRVTESSVAGVFAAALLLANANLQYIQSCPLTEPLYMALSLLALESLIRWRESDHSTLPWAAALWTSLGGLCRYEGYTLLGGILLLLIYDGWTHFISRRTAVKTGAFCAAVFAIPTGLHFGYIWFHTGGVFFHKVAAGNPDPYMTHHNPLLAVVFHFAQISQIAAVLPLIVAVIGMLIFLVQRKEWKKRMPLVLLWAPSLINIAALYWGLVYRLRYSVLLIPAAAIFAGLVMKSETAKKYALYVLSFTVLILPWISWITYKRDPVKMLQPGPGVLVLPAIALLLFMIAQVRRRYDMPLLILCILGLQYPPLARETRPMMTETLEHEFLEPERKEILTYLRQNYDGKRILIDMGRQAPLVYDSRLPVNEFVYNEGGGIFWHKAVQDPVQTVGWLCAEKGDAVWDVIQNDPRIREQYKPAVETETFSLFQLK